MENEQAAKKYFGGTTVEENAEVFKDIDQDGNGSLSWDEFLEGALAKIKAVADG